jgi:hypothetical protein
VTDVIDYAPILADLERRRAEIDQAIATIRAVSGLAPSEVEITTSSALTRPLGSGPGIQRHQFFGLKAPDAIQAYLAVVKEARTASKIASDLKSGGFTTTSRNPANTIRTALVRLEEDGIVVQIDKEWGLASWFPGMRKGGRKPEETTNKNKAKKGKQGKGKKAPKAPPKPRASQKPKKGSEAPTAMHSKYNEFMAEQRRAGKSMAEISAAWRKKKAEG